MLSNNYHKILDKISLSSGIEKDELLRRIGAKRAKLSGMISEEGAAQIVASELGVSFDNEKLKIDELLPGMRKVSVTGKIITLAPVRSFIRNDKENKVAKFMLADNTSNINVVLWDTNHINLIESGEILEGHVVEIINASVREHELHLGSFSELKISQDIIEDAKTSKSFRQKNISDLKSSDQASIRAFIVQSFEPKFFHVCPQCRKKAVMDGQNFRCAEHGNIAAEKKAILNMVIDDGTGFIRSVIFSDLFNLLGIENLENQEEMANQRNSILCKELVFSGNVRINKFFNNPEFNIGEIKEVDINSLINNFENKN